MVLGLTGPKVTAPERPVRVPSRQAGAERPVRSRGPLTAERLGVGAHYTTEVTAVMVDAVSWAS